MVEPANRLHLRRPLITVPYRLYPVADQIADKVCATMDTHYPGGKRSSRVKDLVDLVLIACTQTADLHELSAAITAKRDLSNIAPFDHFDIPAEWTRTYPATAKGVPAAESYTAQTAADLVASFIDPTLDKHPRSATWNPQVLNWTRIKATNRQPGRRLTDVSNRLRDLISILMHYPTRCRHIWETACVTSSRTTAARYCRKHQRAVSIGHSATGCF